MEAYAMTEASHQMTSQTPSLSTHPSSIASVGISHGCQVRIFALDCDEEVQKDGEICVKGPNVFKGYLRNKKANEEAFTKSGYFR